MEKTKTLITYAFSLSLISILVFSSLIIPALAETITYYNLLSNNVGFCMTNTILSVGETPITSSSIIHGKAINGITLTLYKNANPTGNYLVGVWSNSTTPTAINYLYLISTNDSSTLTTTPSSYTFSNLDDSFVLGTNHVIGVFYGSGTVTNNVCVRSNNFASVETSYDGFASQQGIYSTSTGTWGYSSGGRNDLTATIFITDETPSPPSSECPVGTVLDCVGGISPWASVSGGLQAVNITASITDGIGFTNCGNDGDPETCGSGLFLFIFVLLLAEFLSLAGYLGFARKTNSQVQLMDIGLVMLIIGFAVIALGFYLNWIPDVVFYSIIVMVTGLLTFGIIKHIRS